MAMKLHGLLRLFRFELPLAAGACVILGQLLALGRTPPLLHLVAGFFSVFFISAAALILNDYFDVETDRINAPQRPLPAGLVTEREVLLLGTAVSLLGLVLSATLGAAVLATALIVWLLGFLYNWRLKKTGIWGNLLVSLSVAMTFVYGGLTVGVPFAPLVWTFALIAGLVDLGEEIAHDAVDMVGDEVGGSRSLAIQHGPDRAFRIGAALFLLVIGISAVPFLLGWLTWPYLLPILVMDGVILASTRHLLDAEVIDKRPPLRRIYLTSSAAIVVIIVLRLLL